METNAVTLVCPACQAINRLPRARLPDRPRCGRCREPLFRGEPVAVDQAGFDTLIGSTGIPVVVDFWAAWCAPCRAMAPAFDEAARRLEPRVRLAKLDTEAAPDVAARFGIRSIPTLIHFRQGREIARTSGVLDPASLVTWIEHRL